MQQLSLIAVLKNSDGHSAAYVQIFCIFIFATLYVACQGAQAATRSASDNRYNPRQVFDSRFMQNDLTPVRSPSGVPGPKYWQNRADYKISAKLDQIHHILISRDEITYTNNSPDNLTYLWLQLGQNIYRAHSRGQLTAPYGDPRSRRITDGLDIKGVYIVENKKLEKVGYTVNDTNMRIDLPGALPAHGGRISITIDYSFNISDVFYGKWTRMGRMSTPDGPIYAIAQWYPRLVVYDDVTGWNTLPYRYQGEFYLEYGDYKYNIDVPCNYIVAGSGSLTNPNEVLTPGEIERLKKASTSDETIHIRTAPEVNNQKAVPSCHGRRVWKFRINNARDVAWAASPAYVWDAARVTLPGDKHALAMAVYPSASASTSGGWSNIVQYLKKDIEFFSTRYYPYPYPTAVAMAAPVSGMEYPGGFFMSPATKGQQLFDRVTHEIGHTWFPMIVGTNERVYAWMDEGFDVFIEHAALDTNDGQNASTGLRRGRTDAVIKIMRQESFPIMTPADNIPDNQVVPIEYRKAAFGLSLLRNYILSPKNFDHAFKAYIEAWAYRHPTPYDFFRLMNNETGENLDWFWKEWYFESWKLDQAISDVNYVNDNPKEGSVITISNNDRMAMPVVVKIREFGGKTITVKLPVEIWTEGDIWKFRASTNSKIESVEIDPDHLLPDVDRANNIWPSPR